MTRLARLCTYDDRENSGRPAVAGWRAIDRSLSVSVGLSVTLAEYESRGADCVRGPPRNTNQPCVSDMLVRHIELAVEFILE